MRCLARTGFLKNTVRFLDRGPNLVHVVINNGAHESVGGMPTVADQIDLVGIAKACGYPNAVCVDSFEALDATLEAAKTRNELSFIEVKCAIGARADLGRPTTTPKENKEAFMGYLESLWAKGNCTPVFSHSQVLTRVE